MKERFVELASLFLELGSHHDFNARLAEPDESRPRRPAGSDRWEATTTRTIPAAMIASVQGGVRPVWACGSSET